MRTIRQSLVCLCLATCLVVGCAVSVPYVGQGPHPQIRRGRPVLLIDTLGNVFSLIPKLLFWSGRMDNHAISAQTEEVLVKYLNSVEDSPALKDTLFRLNEYRPIDDLNRIFRNRHVAWPYRILLGLPTTLLWEVILPGRIFGGILGGDHYNPFTNTVHVYSDHKAIVLHETGHAHDFAQQRYKGLYATLRIIPGVDLLQEFVATEKTIDFFIANQNRTDELDAYRILYPAYGTYIGSYIIPYGAYPGIAVGHIWGRLKARSRAKTYRILDKAHSVSSPGDSDSSVVTQSMEAIHPLDESETAATPSSTDPNQ